MTFTPGVSGNPSGLRHTPVPAYGEAYWRPLLVRAPLWALEDELARRHEEDLAVLAIRIGDLVVDPVGSLVRWRGEDYAVSGRKMEVLYALALGWLQGRKRLRPVSLARMVWRGGFTEAEAGTNLRVVIKDIRRQIPGLIAGGRERGIAVGYCFAVSTAVVATRIEAA